MQFGVQLLNYFTTWEEILSVIKIIDAGPWSSLWVSDHFLPPFPRANLESETALEGWSLITATAAVTTRIPIGVLVTGNTYRFI